MNKLGKLYGIGIGPGDPELLTLKAIKRIQASQVIAVPGKDKEESVAYQITIQAIPDLAQKECLAIPMPMTKDREDLQRAHQEGAEKICEVLNKGQDIAFLTLGDPTIYATYMYLHKLVQAAGYETEMINGIPSFCAVAAKLNISLAEQSKQLHIIPASYDIEEAMNYPGNLILMKAGRKLDTVKKQLLEHPDEKEIYMVENCGMEGEQVYLEAKNMPDAASYYTIVVVKEKE